MRTALRLFASSALAVAAFAVLVPTAAFAGGPLANCQQGQPFLWPNGGTNIPFNPDQGDLGPLSNAAAVALVSDAFAAWGAIPTASTTYVNAGPLPEDVTIDNFEPYFNAPAPDGLSAIVFDDTGEIFDLLFGPGSGVLGFAGPEWGNTAACTITEGLSFLNGPAFGDAAEALDVIVHEFGHYQNLAHTVVNGQILLGDNSGPTPNDTFPIPPLAGLIETMYPFYFGPAAGTSTPHKDDIAMLSTLYPEPTFFATTGRITGNILAPNGTTRLTGVNVIARNVANPYIDAVSSISSDLAVTYVDGQPFVGLYTLRGLTPGATYAIFVDEILAGGFSTPPLFPLPGPEEFYNGAAESNNGSTDVPTAFTPVAAAAGATVSNINIIFNTPSAGAPLPVGDDGSVQLFLPFPFKICNQNFDSVFVNANGNLTFGAPNADFSESIVEFLAGPPRIAGLWDDLNNDAGGTVFFNQTSNTFTVTYQNVPEYLATGANTFSIVLHKSSYHVDVTYGALTATDGLAGVSCGGAVTSGFERAIDLTQNNGRKSLNDEAAVFELFGPGNPVDLSNRQVKYNVKVTFNDKFENNNTISKAKKIKLPFDSAETKRFTKIEPEGNDVDYFEFDIDAGEILAIETVRGNLDTVIGVFDADTGDLLAADDDGGDGLLSRLLLQANEDLELAIAVSTFPDVEFTGAGEGAGRYVLVVHKYEGTVLAAGDDTSTPVNFNGFTFPFQGTNWSSVFVNSNGNFTFGVGDADFSETVPEFLAGPPRIAPRWDDFNAAGGLVIAEPDDDDKLTIHFVSVPEFGTTSPNYFSVEFDEDGDTEIEYFATTRTDGLTGITQGGGAADPGEEDLSEDDDHSATGTTYELFSAADVFSFDLFFSDLEFERHGHDDGDDDDEDDDDDDDD